jgi:hypothetical protein
MYSITRLLLNREHRLEVDSALLFAENLISSLIVPDTLFLFEHTNR